MPLYKKAKRLSERCHRFMHPPIAESCNLYTICDELFYIVFYRRSQVDERYSSIARSRYCRAVVQVPLVLIERDIFVKEVFRTLGPFYAVSSVWEGRLH